MCLKRRRITSQFRGGQMLKWKAKGLVLAIACLALVSPGNAQNKPKAEQAGKEESGKQWFMAYCASCHGDDAKGHGVVAPALKQAPPNLTLLAKRNNGKFPEEYVDKVLAHGVPAPAHGTAEMPVWGPTFASVNSRKLIEYLESIQVK
jgi:mono/diheme cytochrome c family protein